MITPSFMDSIQQYNAGRDPELLARKYHMMRGDAFAFLRGSCHLFYQHLPVSDTLHHAPSVWVCGDLHLDNFGSFKGENGLVYFDINDFDEAALAPLTWDLLRFLTGLLVASETLGINEEQTITLCRYFVTAYSYTVSQGKTAWVERAISKGVVGHLLRQLKHRKQKEFLNERTKWHGKHRQIRIDGKKALNVTQSQRDKITAFMADYALQQEHPAFFELLDVAKRIAGLSSLGIERYVLLIKGKGSSDKNRLLDLKKARPSALLPYLNVVQPQWANDAERITSVQRWSQAMPPAYLQSVTLMEDESFILKELQPHNDRLDFKKLQGEFKHLQHVVTVMAEMIAWEHLRSHSRQGSASPEQLLDFAVQRQWQQEIIDLAVVCSRKTIGQWQEFKEWGNV